MGGPFAVMRAVRFVLCLQSYCVAVRAVLRCRPGRFALPSGPFCVAVRAVLRCRSGRFALPFGPSCVASGWPCRRLAAVAVVPGRASRARRSAGHGAPGGRWAAAMGRLRCRHGGLRDGGWRRKRQVLRKRGARRRKFFTISFVNQNDWINFAIIRD